MNMQTIFAIGLVVSGALGWVGMQGYSYYKSRPAKPVTPDFTPGLTTSDTPAPSGVPEYLAMVERASVSAPDPVRWGYAKQGLSEAAVLRSEVERLNAGAPK